VEGREEHRLRVWVERRKHLPVLDDDLADGGETFLAEDLLEEVEGLATDRLGLQVVGRLDEAGAVLVAGCGIDEELDLDERTVLSGTASMSSSVMTTYWFLAYS
jgi:hypothetical protein